MGGTAASRWRAPELGRIPIRPPTVQAKLSVQAQGDAFEQQADRIATQVTGAPDSRGEHLRTQGPGTTAGTEAPPIVHDVLRSPGRPLDAGTRAFFEPRLAHDFAAVRIHTDSAAARSAQAIGARAYTADARIVFDAGQYAPATQQGRHLLAHELTHVVQQAAGTPGVIRRAPWGSCPEGPRRGASNPFIYGPAELYAVGQYMAQNPGHCIMTNEMLAGGIVPACSDREQPMVDAIMRDFHHGYDARRRAVAPADNVTRRPEGKSGALIQSGLETVKALQQPDILDFTTCEVYDVTTTGQREVKSRKFKSRYLPLLNAITHASWTAGTRLKAFKPLVFKIPKFGAICFGPTDLQRWPGVIQYEVIGPEDAKKKGKGKKKDDKKGAGKKKDAKGQAAPPGGNIGFGIGVFSSGAGKGNAVLGIAINAHGTAYGTVSAGIVYDANGNAVAAASVGAAVRSSANAALAAGAGTAKDNPDTTAVASAASGSAERMSTVTIASAGQGEATDADGAQVAKRGSGSGRPGDAQPGGEPLPAQAGGGQAGTGGLQIPGKTDAEVAQAVAEAARIDAALHAASTAQKDLLAYLAQQLDDQQYQVPDVRWVATFLQATAGLSDTDLQFLQTQAWTPGHVTAQELRKHIDERLQNRHRPQRPKGAGPAADKQKAAAADAVKPDAGAKAAKAAKLDKAAGPEPQESDQQAYRRLLDRARQYDWGHLAAVGVLEYDKQGKVYAPDTVRGMLYISTTVDGKRQQITADVAGLLTKSKGGDILEIQASSIIVAVDGRAASATRLIGEKIVFQP